MIFTDETTFVLNQPQYGWTLPGHSLQQKSLTYNPKVKVWGSISSKGKVFFTRFERTLNSKRYIALIHSGFLQKARELFQNNWVLQQDGARSHTAKNTIKNLNEEGVKVLE